MQEEYEEIEFTCEMCGKKVKRIRRKSDAPKTYLCQNCGKKIVET